MISPIRIGVIGTAGRRQDAARMSRSVYAAMYRDLCRRLSSYTQEVRLVSGGAAWSDHLAVSAFLGGVARELELHLPADLVSGRYAEGSSDGGVANHYHERFSVSMGQSSFSSLDDAIKRGARTIVYDGFKQRNIGIAQNVDVLIAYTWRRPSVAIEGVELVEGPTDGGTAHTWQAACDAHVLLKIHVLIDDVLERSIRTSEPGSSS